METIAERSKTQKPQTLSPGARLKSARLAMRLSVRETANRLHIKPHIIELMEDDQFDNSLPEIFMRGFFRSYARFLNFSTDEIAQALNEIHLPPPPSQTNYVPNKNFNIQQHDRYVHWITYLALITLGSLVGLWWWSVHTNNLNTLTELARNKVTAMMSPTNGPFYLSKANAEIVDLRNPIPVQAPTNTDVNLAASNFLQSNSILPPVNVIPSLPPAPFKAQNNIAPLGQTPVTSQAPEAAEQGSTLPSDFAQDVPESGL